MNVVIMQTLEEKKKQNSNFSLFLLIYSNLILIQIFCEMKRTKKCINIPTKLKTYSDRFWFASNKTLYSHCLPIISINIINYGTVNGDYISSGIFKVAIYF